MAQRPRDLEPESSAAALFGAELRQRRVLAGLSQAGLARMVHVSCDLIGKVEKAQRRPMPDLVARLDAVLGAEGDLASLARDVASRQELPTPVPEQVLTSLPGDDVAVALREVLSGIRRLDHGLGSGHAVSALMAHARLSEALVSSLGGRAQREVLLTLGEVHQLAGWIAFDRDELGHAQESFVKARSYAELAGSDALVAYILGPSHGFAVTYSGDPRHGARRCDEALTRARRSGNQRLTAFVLAIGARAHAKLGGERSSLGMLDEAEQLLARHRPDEPDPVWLEVFDEAALRGHRGAAWSISAKQPERLTRWRCRMRPRRGCSFGTGRSGFWTAPGRTPPWVRSTPRARRLVRRWT